MSPKNQERLFKKEYAKELCEIASGDLESAKGLLEISKGRPENICFLVQQSMEKAIKAVLCFYEVPVPLVHDLGVLIAKLPTDVSPPEGYRLIQFNEYATVRRYEEGEAILTVAEIQLAVSLGEQVLSWAKSIAI